jgi:patatin-like phospholipase/acyl hydrolase
MRHGLSIRGGGIFGYSIAKLLWMADADPHNDFDFFAGTSIGSALAAAYAQGQSAEEVYSFFLNKGPLIFQRSWYRAMIPTKFASKYSDEYLNKYYKEFLPGKYLDPQNVSKPLIVPAAELKSGKPKIFDNITKDDDYMLWEIARMSSAAPTYFPPYKTREGIYYIDGGLVANDPSAVAITAMTDKAGIAFSKQKVLSIGTGYSDFENSDDFRFIFSWLPILLNIVMEGGNEDMHAKLASCILKGKRFCLWNEIPLKRGWDMDDPSLFTELDKLCDRAYPSFHQAYTTFVKR